MDAAEAIRALGLGDLSAVSEQLAVHRGDEDFAYFFTSRATPRSLGDALSSVADGGASAPLRTQEDGLAYEVVLADLAGVLSLATQGTGGRQLPSRWTDHFIWATTTPEILYGVVDRASDHAERVRAHQDAANRQNLLLLLSRGNWSTDFLKKVTAAYWDFDHDKGGAAWAPGRLEDAKYAPAPTGVFLTDGIVALSAALTANPDASEWAFTDFRPGSKEIEGSNYAVGKFTHYLLFEHAYPAGADGKSLGMTAALTALASATGAPTPSSSSSSGSGPLHDSAVLQAFSKDAHEGESGSCSIRVYDCVMTAAKAVAHLAEWVWERIGHWGHFALDILALATFAPPPVMFVGVGASAANASWYAIEGDYVMAGISLATAVPGLALGKLSASVKATKVGTEVTGAVVAAKGATVGRALEIASARADKVARVVRVWWRGAKATDREIAEAGAKNVGTAAKSTYPNEKDFQHEIAEKIPGARKEARLETNCTTTCSGNRHVDVFDENTGTCIEVKTGNSQSNKQYELGEVEKDLMLLKNKNCRSVKWVFGPDMDGKVGPYDALRQRLQKRGIPYEILKAAA